MSLARGHSCPHSSTEKMHCGPRPYPLLGAGPPPGASLWAWDGDFNMVLCLITSSHREWREVVETPPTMLEAPLVQCWGRGTNILTKWLLCLQGDSQHTMYDRRRGLCVPCQHIAPSCTGVGGFRGILVIHQGPLPAEGRGV